MNKVTYIWLIIMVVSSILFQSNGNASDNFLSLRYEIGEKENGDSFQKTYSIFDNNSLEKWFLGCEFMTGNDDFKAIVPHIFRKIGQSGWQIGGNYHHSNFDKKIGPGIRYFGKTPLKTFTKFTGTYYFDLEKDQRTVDTWLNISRDFGRWQIGSEILYYQTFNGGSKSLSIRPIRIGYRLNDAVMPFIMAQKKWRDNNKENSVSILAGIAFKF